jgi:hypothetical protein
MTATSERQLDVDAQVAARRVVRGSGLGDDRGTPSSLFRLARVIAPSRLREALATPAESLRLRFQIDTKNSGRKALQILGFFENVSD